MAGQRSAESNSNWTAAADSTKSLSAGMLFMDPQGYRRAYVVHIRPEIFEVWSHHEAKIDQLIGAFDSIHGVSLQRFVCKRDAWHLVR